MCLGKPCVAAITCWLRGADGIACDSLLNLMTLHSMLLCQIELDVRFCRTCECKQCNANYKKVIEHYKRHEVKKHNLKKREAHS